MLKQMISKVDQTEALKVMKDFCSKISEQSYVWTEGGSSTYKSKKNIGFVQYTYMFSIFCHDLSKNFE